MGWKGAVRSIAAASRRANREAERRYKEQLKQNLIDEAEDAVWEWQCFVDNLKSVHIDLAESIDWHEIAERLPPPEPQLTTVHEKIAEKKLSKFKPSVIDLLFGGSEKRQQRLEKELIDSKKKDADVLRINQENYVLARKEWQDESELAKRLLSGDSEAIVEVINEVELFKDEELLGSEVNFKITDGFIHAKPVVHSNEIVPKNRLKQLVSGKLSETKMPIGQFNELYQDYVCSVALRLAGDLFQVLPVEELIVSCEVSMLNPSNGHFEITPILSVHFVRDTFSKLSLEKLDPSDSMRNFRHNMNFKKTKGFSKVDVLV